MTPDERVRFLVQVNDALSEARSVMSEGGDRMSFLSGEAELPGSADLIGRLQGMVESLATKAERARADADLGRAHRALFTVLEVRGIVVPDAARERILAQEDPERLEQWLKRAVSAASLAAVLDETG